jgi:hypothetical protein
MLHWSSFHPDSSYRSQDADNPADWHSVTPPWRGKSTFWLAAHSWPTYLVIGSDTEGQRIYGPHVAGVVRRDPRFQQWRMQNPNGWLVLAACEVGLYEDGVAQQIADYLGITVSGANNEMAVVNEGRGGRLMVDSPGERGEFRTFHPDTNSSHYIKFRSGETQLSREDSVLIDHLARTAAENGLRTASDLRSLPVIGVSGYSEDPAHQENTYARMATVENYFRARLTHHLRQLGAHSLRPVDFPISSNSWSGNDIPPMLAGITGRRSSYITITIHNPRMREVAEFRDMEEISFAGPRVRGMSSPHGSPYHGMPSTHASSYSPYGPTNYHDPT